MVGPVAGGWSRAPRTWPTMALCCMSSSPIRGGASGAEDEEREKRSSSSKQQQQQQQPEKCEDEFGRRGRSGFDGASKAGIYEADDCV